MNRMEIILSLILVLSPLLVCGTSGSAAVPMPGGARSERSSKSFLSGFWDCIQHDDGACWYYAVTDPDHNGPFPSKRRNGDSERLGDRSLRRRTIVYARRLL